MPVAVGLDRIADVESLASSSNENERLIALTLAAFYGKTDMITYLLNIGANPNGYPKNGEGFHAHATPLHQAVSSGSLDAVKLLVEAGADLNVTDLVYQGTPLGWAEHMKADAGSDDVNKKKFEAIANYLRYCMNRDFSDFRDL